MPDARDFIGLYTDLYEEGGEPDCPGTGLSFNGRDVDASGCRTAAGWEFAGAAEYRPEQNSLQCDCRIVAPDGRMIQGAGTVIFEEAGDAVRNDLRGSFRSVGGAGWLEARASVLIAYVIDDGQGFVDGGFTVEGVSADLGLVFGEGRCDLGEGTVRIRDDSGGWYDLALSAETCDGCGALSFAGQDLGEHCVDMDALRQAVLAVLQ